MCQVRLPSDPSVFKLVFISRSPEQQSVGRTILNEAQLIEQCNAAAGADAPPPFWRVPYKRFFCFAHTFGANQLMDVWLMRRVGGKGGGEGARACARAYVLALACRARDGQAVCDLPHTSCAKMSPSSPPFVKLAVHQFMAVITYLQVDALVGMHGAGLTNALFMKRGGAVLEVRPFGFSGRESWANRYARFKVRRGWGGGGVGMGGALGSG